FRERVLLRCRASKPTSASASSGLGLTHLARVRHEWIVAPRRSEKARASGPTHLVDCRREHRGPYAGSGALLREIVPDAYRRMPETVLRHALTLLSIAPELRDAIPVSPELARSFEFSREGNSRYWTLRLAHGVVDFLLA